MVPALEVENLRVHFFLDEGIVRAVDGVSFSRGVRENPRYCGRIGKRKEC